MFICGWDVCSQKEEHQAKAVRKPGARRLVQHPQKTKKPPPSDLERNNEPHFCSQSCPASLASPELPESRSISRVAEAAHTFEVLQELIAGYRPSGTKSRGREGSVVVGISAPGRPEQERGGSRV